MIRRDRSSISAPRVLIDVDGAGARERTKALAHFGAATPPAKAFSFKAYGDKQVREALESLFAGKCAYCESRFTSIQPVDVEHWRPKSEVHENDAKLPGYYWLAATWENLLPSCIDCNRVRKHTMAESGEERTLGKGNRFPLVASDVRATTPGGETSEHPLILNPCVDDPGEHLEFGDEGVIRPRVDATGTPSARGEASIEVYALNRAALALERREAMLRIRERIAALALLLEMLDVTKEPRVLELGERLVEHELRSLHRLAEPDQPFAAMAKQLVDAELAHLLGATGRDPRDTASTDTGPSGTSPPVRPPRRRRAARDVNVRI